MKQKLQIVLWLTVVLIFPFSAYASELALIQKHDESSVRTLLNEEVPDLIIDTITLIHSGQDHLVAEVNDEWIFRFPLTEEYKPKLQFEKILLDRLKDRVLLPVPYYLYSGTHVAFAGYRKIQGVPLNREIYLTLTEEVRQRVAESLAQFLNQLHSAVSVHEALKWGYEHYFWAVKWIEYDLIGTLPSVEIERIVGEALAYAKQHPCAIDNLVLLHNDLHGGNMAFDIKKEQLNGVFDFSDAEIGEHSIEFSKLFCVHPDLAIRTASVYTRLKNVTNPIRGAAADYILRRAKYILHAREEGDSARECNLIKMLEDFIPIWDELNI